MERLLSSIWTVSVSPLSFPTNRNCSLKNYCVFIYFSVCVYVHMLRVLVHAYVGESKRAPEGARGQLVRVGSLLPQCGTWESNSGGQTWRQVSLSADPSCWPQNLPLRKKMARTRGWSSWLVLLVQHPSGTLSQCLLSLEMTKQYLSFQRYPTSSCSSSLYAG